MSEGKKLTFDVRFGVHEDQDGCSGSGHGTDKDIMTKEQQEAERFKQDTHHRKILVIWTMAIISAWLAGVLCLTFIAGLRDGMSDVVFTALLTTTTINVLGLAMIILNNLFPNKKKHEEDGKSAGV